MKRLNHPVHDKKKIKKDQKVPAFAPRFPSIYEEGWWAILYEKNAGAAFSGTSNIHSFEKFNDNGKESLSSTPISSKFTSDEIFTSHEIKMMAPPKAGSYSLDLQLFCDAYVGIDIMVPLSFDVLPASDLPAYTPHQEDLDLDNEPTLFEQVMSANLDEEDSSDDDSDDDEDEKSNSAPSGSSASSRKAGVLIEDASDSD